MRLSRALLWLSLVPGLLIAVYLLAAVGGAVWPGSRAVIGGEPEVEVLLVSGPIHYDLLLPLTDATRAEFGFAAAAGVPVDAPEAEWLVVGWGARAFYTTAGSYADVSASAVWQGIRGDRSVMHLNTVGQVDAPERFRRIMLGTAGFAALRGAVLASFERDAAGRVVPLQGLHFGPNDAFFAARGRFDLLRTCNVWLGEVLRASGQRFGIWTPTPYAVSVSHWWFDG